MHLLGTVSDIDKGLAISILSLVFHSHCSVLPYSTKVCSFISMEIIWKMLEKARDGTDAMYHVIYFEWTHSCFMCKRLWKLETWTQLSVCNRIHPQQGSYSPISCHDCCVTRSLCILLFLADYVLIFQLCWFCFAFLCHEGQVCRVKGSLTQAMW